MVLIRTQKVKLVSSGRPIPALQRTVCAHL